MIGVLHIPGAILATRFTPHRRDYLRVIVGVVVAARQLMRRAAVFTLHDGSEVVSIFGGYGLYFHRFWFLVVGCLTRKSATPNHALQRTAPRVTARAFCVRRFLVHCSSFLRSTVGHAPRHAPPSLSLRSLGRTTRMPDLSPQDYERAVSEFTRLAADDFRPSATEQEQRAAICRYFRRGAAVDFSHPELIDFLGVSTPSVLDMAGYSDAAAQRVMEMLAGITDEQIQSATV